MRGWDPHVSLSTSKSLGPGRSQSSLRNLLFGLSRKLQKPWFRSCWETVPPPHLLSLVLGLLILHRHAFSFRTLTGFLLMPLWNGHTWDRRLHLLPREVIETDASASLNYLAVAQLIKSISSGRQKTKLTYWSQRTSFVILIAKWHFLKEWV